MERGYCCMPDVLLVSLQTELRFVVFFFFKHCFVQVWI